MSSDGPTITSLELEDRRFPPPPEFAAQANATEELYDAAAADPEAFWLAQTARSCSPGRREPTQGVRPLQPAVLHVVRGRHPERERQLPRPPPRVARRPGRLPLGGRARRRAARDHLPRPPRARLPAGERAARARRRQGRPGGDLPRHDPGDRRRDARLRAHRRAAHGDLRRLLARQRARPRARLRLHRGDHRRRRLARRQAGAAEGERRRGARGRARTCTPASWCGAPSRRSAGSRAATSGTTSSSPASRPRPSRR